MTDKQLFFIYIYQNYEKNSNTDMCSNNDLVVS